MTLTDPLNYHGDNSRCFFHHFHFTNRPLCHFTAHPAIYSFLLCVHAAFNLVCLPKGFTVINDHILHNSGPSTTMHLNQCNGFVQTDSFVIWFLLWITIIILTLIFMTSIDCIEVHSVNKDWIEDDQLSASVASVLSGKVYGTIAVHSRVKLHCSSCWKPFKHNTQVKTHNIHLFPGCL